MGELQLALFEPDVGPLEHAFQRFHEENPDVYERLVHLSRYLKSKGWEKGSINLLFERLRWEYAVATNGGKFRLNNNHRAFYARLLMRQEPDLRDWFEVRGTDHGSN